MNSDKDSIKKEINKLIDSYFKQDGEKFIPGKSKVPLMVPQYGSEEVKEAVESLLSTYVTMGEKVKQFEKMFAEYMQVKHAVMVNSGSSAALLALHSLSSLYHKNGIEKGDEIITSPLTWSTTVSSIVNFGAVPVFVDVDINSYNIDPGKIEDAITEKTKAIMPVHLLGNPCDMHEIRKIADDNNLFVIEDTCESYGAELSGKKAGSFGHAAITSFFFSHHITTIEGGMILANEQEHADILRSLRAHGWIREMSSKDSILKQHPGLDPRFFFYTSGFNVRPTDIQGAFGLHQLPKLEKFIEIRRNNARYLNDGLHRYDDYLILPEERKDTRHVYFCYALTVKKNATFTKNELISYLESRNIETRPIETGNILNHPVSKIYNYKANEELRNADYIHNNSFFIGNHHGFTDNHLNFIVESIGSFIKSKGGK